MQGFNMGRYVPPEAEGRRSGNSLHGKRPPGTGSGAGRGPTVRFEMPYAVWCQSCPQPTLIGQGVRFNAEKRRVGAYYSTPVWSFRFRHPDCGGQLEIRTDPRTSSYLVVAGGARRRQPGDDDDNDNNNNSSQPPARADADADAARRQTAISSLEKTIADREQAAAAEERLGLLRQLSARQWSDPYAQNQRLRRDFRPGRRQRDRQAAADEDLSRRLGLELDLVPASEEDARRAALVDFGPDAAADDDDDDDDDPNNGHGPRASDRKTLSKPLFPVEGSRPPAPPPPPPPSSRRRSRAPAEASRQHRDELLSELVACARTANDPFLRTTAPARRRRRPPVATSSASAAPADRTGPPSSGLVEYDSD